MNKKTGFVLSLMFIIGSILISNVFAITGSIGNARMVLRAEQGDTIEKYILVKNVNNVSLDIELSASGDLEKYVKIKDDKFTLQAGEEKKAYFTIKVAKAGTTETKINIKFTPQDGKNGVGLSSTVIVIANKSEGWFDWDNEEEENNKDEEGDNVNNTEGVSVTTGKVISKSKLSKSFIVPILLTITGITALIFIILLILVFIKTKKKNRKEEKIKLKKRVKINE